MNSNPNSVKDNNKDRIYQFFSDFLHENDYEGVFGVAKFSLVFKDLMPVQKKRLEKLLKEELEEYKNLGNIISLGLFYPDGIIEGINVSKNNVVYKEYWDQYGDEYAHLNNLLSEIGEKIAHEFNGICVPPTTGVPTEKISHVSDYFPHTISHRVVAEHAGIGWRGKNDLIVTTAFGPAVRFTSILCKLPLKQGHKIETQCGECDACLRVCPILEKKDNLGDHREKCRNFILSLDLKHNVCGKCIKACFKEGIWRGNLK
ncbi:MAG: hypothetical protein JW891_16250 [Candidatus Lokiarchaeota archaeon]|nr:hypothetical protein [Candidatus Lokiarchaeota archaeon]